MAPSVADRSRVTILQAIILGLVEGVTEYLPVSSTGHLILTAWLLGLSEDAAKKAALDSFNIVIQGGAILAVLGLYRARVAAMVKGLSGANHAGLMLFLKLIVAFLPAAVLGLMFNKAIKERLFLPLPVLMARGGGGVLLLVLSPWIRTLVGRERIGDSDGAAIDNAVLDSADGTPITDSADSNTIIIDEEA